MYKINFLKQTLNKSPKNSINKFHKSQLFLYREDKNCSKIFTKFIIWLHKNLTKNAKILSHNLLNMLMFFILRILTRLFYLLTIKKTLFLYKSLDLY
jgi:hypothetical protein